MWGQPLGLFSIIIISEFQMKNMLLIEDDYLSVKLMIKIFRDDYIITNCNSAEEYYEKCLGANFDIIIMDISLKGKKTGLDLIKEIKEEPTYTGTPILCLTAHADSKAREAALENGADCFLIKPVQNRVLIKNVRSLIEKVIESN